MSQYVVTIARQFGSLGRPIAKALAEILGIEYYDRDIVEATAEKMGLPVSVISDQEEKVKSGFFRWVFSSEWEVQNSRLRFLMNRPKLSEISQNASHALS